MALDDIKIKLHFVVLPWLAFGHLLPFLELSKFLATKGHRVSFISTARNLERLPKLPQSLLQQITLIPIQLPRVENLRPDAGASTDLPADEIPVLKKAYDSLREEMPRVLEAATPVDWIIHDFNTWIRPVADRLGIKKAFFIATNAWTIAVMTPSQYTKESEDGLKNISDNLKLRVLETRKRFGDIPDTPEQTGISIENCDVVIIRSCMEFEAESLKLLQMLLYKPVVPAGLLPRIQNDSDDENDTWRTISGWLEKQKQGSVVYVALGSEVLPTQDLITEIALGLEASQLPFFWVLRKVTGINLDIPDGFEDRTKSRGLVWTSWAPQPKILAHDSVGAFLTHCGYGSVIEGLQSGRPLIMLPFVNDQGFNAEIVEEKKAGVAIPKNEDGSISKRSVAETMKLVLKDEAGEIYRKEAAKMRGIVGDKQLQSQYLEKMEEFLCNYNSAGKASVT